jgi:hypothetical protein
MEVMTQEKEVATNDQNVKEVNEPAYGTLTYGKVTALIMALNDLEASSPQMPFGVAYAVNKNVGKLSTKAKTVNETRAALIDFYVQKDETGKPKHVIHTEEEIKAGAKPEFLFAEGDKEKCEKELSEFLKMAVKDVTFHKIKLSYIKDTIVNSGRIRYFDLLAEFIIDEDVTL